MVRESLHILVAVALGAALGVPPAPPLVGFTLAAAAGVALLKAGIFSGDKRSQVLEYAGALILAWVITASILHY